VCAATMVAASFGRRSRHLLPPCFGHFSFSLLSSHQHSRKMGMQLVGCNFILYLYPILNEVGVFGR